MCVCVCVCVCVYVCVCVCACWHGLTVLLYPSNCLFLFLFVCGPLSSSPSSSFFLSFPSPPRFAFFFVLFFISPQTPSRRSSLGLVVSSTQTTELELCDVEHDANHPSSANDADQQQTLGSGAEEGEKGKSADGDGGDEDEEEEEAVNDWLPSSYFTPPRIKSSQLYSTHVSASYAHSLLFVFTHGWWCMRVCVCVCA